VSWEHSVLDEGAYSVVLILSNGVTASKDSVTPAPKPAITVRGPETLPSASANNALYWSNATKPAGTPSACSHIPTVAAERWHDIRIPAFNEFPIMSVVHPAYHAFPNGGQGSFFASGNLRLSCVRVFATAYHISYVFSGSLFRLSLNPSMLQNKCLALILE
jgi:hypothetical protein